VMATHEGLTVGMPLRQRSAGKSAAPNEEQAPAESSSINMSHTEEAASSTGLCANLLNATCADKVVNELRWVVLALAGIAWSLQFCFLFAPWRDNGSSLVYLRLGYSSWGGLTWIDWQFLWRWHAAWYLIGLGGLLGTRFADPGKWSPDNSYNRLASEEDPKVKMFLDILEEDQCDRCGAPTIPNKDCLPDRFGNNWKTCNLEFTHCGDCKICVYLRSHHCCLIGVCVGYGNRLYFVLLLFAAGMSMSATIVAFSLTQMSDLIPFALHMWQLFLEIGQQFREDNPWRSEFTFACAAFVGFWVLICAVAAAHEIWTVMTRVDHNDGAKEGDSD